jgi:hemerythrin
MPTIKDDLCRDHEAHERMLVNLVESIDRNTSPKEFRLAWARLEKDLLEHLDAEEHSLFCVFTQAHQHELITLLGEHRRIRHAVIELSVCAALHTIKREALDSLLALLREHTRHEDQTLHKWLDEDEGISSRRGVLAMQARRARALEEERGSREQAD